MKFFLLTLFCIIGILTFNIGYVFSQNLESYRAKLKLVEITNLSSKELVKIKSADYDFIGEIKAGSVKLVVTTPEFNELIAQGYNVGLIREGRPFKEIQAESKKSKASLAGYSNLSKILEELKSVQRNYPSITKVIDLTKKYETPSTFEGRHLYAIKISDNVDKEEDEPDILIVSNHHAREVVTPLIALKAINEFTSKYNTDAEIKSMVDNNEIWIAPTWNPDGYNYVFEVDDLWRKNRRIFDEGVGVDQNRNYPFLWGSASSGSDDVLSNGYRGPSPGSEAETKTMIAFTEDQIFEKILDFHSRGREVLYTYHTEYNYPFESWHSSIARNLSNKCGYKDTRKPSSNAEHYQWQLGMFGALSFLIETHIEFSPPYASALEEAEKVQGGIKWMIQKNIPLYGNVTDKDNGDPIEAQIELVGEEFKYKETNFSDSRFGFYRVFAPAGNYTIRFSADGYGSKQENISISENEETEFDIQLTLEALSNNNISDTEDNKIKSFDIFPNPSLDYAVFKFDIESSGLLTIELFDILGRNFGVVLKDYRGIGDYRFRWNLTDESGNKIKKGFYLVRFNLKCDGINYFKTGKLMVL